MMHDDFDAFELGVGFAAASLMLDAQTRSINEAVAEAAREATESLRPPHGPGGEAPRLVTPDLSDDWDRFFGQEPLKKQMRVHIDAAKKQGRALPHTLLASGAPGVGKTSLARILAREMGAQLVTIVPPFRMDALRQAVSMLRDRDVLLIDEVHKMADGGQKGAEILLHLLEEGVLRDGSSAQRVADITVIATTTDPDRLPETILDRFPIKPHFQPYSVYELTCITARFEGQLQTELDLDVTIGIAKACRGVPRVARELVMAARDLQLHLDRKCTLDELLAFKETSPDGMTRQHHRYLQVMLEHFGRKGPHGMEYVAGEDSLSAMLRESKSGLHRLERFLMEQGLLTKTSRGRQLTPLGVRIATRNRGTG